MKKIAACYYSNVLKKVEDFLLLCKKVEEKGMHA